MGRGLFDDKPKITFAVAVVYLIAHLIGSGILFVSFFFIGWCVSFAIHWLNLLHQMQPATLGLIAKFEIYITYADAFLCACVIIAGAFRFIKNLGDME